MFIVIERAKTYEAATIAPRCIRASGGDIIGKPIKFVANSGIPVIAIEMPDSQNRVFASIHSLRAVFKQNIVVVAEIETLMKQNEV